MRGIRSLQVSSCSPLAEGRAVGSRAVTQGSLRKLDRRTQLHQLVLGKQLRMMKFVYMPAAPDPHRAHQVKGTQPCLPFGHPAGCLAVGRSPPLGLWLRLESALLRSF